MNKKSLCIGGGPAGLTVAYLLSQKKQPVTVLEADSKYLGGISTTVFYKGYFCDIGGHRFFSKSEKVNQLWREILDEGFILRPRKSRIYYQNNFFDYPLKPTNALFNLGIWESSLCVLSYLKSALFPIKEVNNFEQWVSNKFGYRLFSIFFRSYTEKVWGTKCSEISADWAAQRIKGLSLFSAIKNALLPQKNKKKIVKTLINSFHYPRKGPGMMWDAAADKIKKQGGIIEMGEKVISLKRQRNKWKVISKRGKTEHTHTADFVISSAPIRELINSLESKPPNKVVQAANQLKYRDFLVVGLIVQDKNIFDDNWIYIHDPKVKVGRIQNFKSWSPEMVAEKDKNCYGMEYFCIEGDGLWTSKNSDLITQARDELIKLGLAQKKDILDGFVIRQKKSLSRL